MKTGRVASGRGARVDTPGPVVGSSPTAPTIDTSSALVREVLKVEREARARSIDTKALWQAVEDDMANRPGADERTRVRRAWRVLYQDWEVRRCLSKGS